MKPNKLVVGFCGHDLKPGFLPISISFMGSAKPFSLLLFVSTSKHNDLKQKPIFNKSLVQKVYGTLTITFLVEPILYAFVMKHAKTF
jgi:hypothetical protein